MNKFLHSFITIERTFQILALVGLILFLGYIGLNSSRKGQTPSAPTISPAAQLK